MLILSQNKDIVFDTTGVTIMLEQIISGSEKCKIIGFGNNNPSDAVVTLGIYNPDKAKEIICNLFEYIQTEFSGYVMPE